MAHKDDTVAAVRSAMEQHGCEAYGNPYHVLKRDGKFLVVKNDDGKVMGTHDTRQKAMKQFAALEIAAHKES